MNPEDIVEQTDLVEAVEATLPATDEVVAEPELTAEEVTPQE